MLKVVLLEGQNLVLRRRAVAQHATDLVVQQVQVLAVALRAPLYVFAFLHLSILCFCAFIPLCLCQVGETLLPAAGRPKSISAFLSQ